MGGSDDASDKSIADLLRSATGEEVKNALAQSEDEEEVKKSFFEAYEEVQVLLASLEDVEALQKTISEHITETKNEIASNRTIRLWSCVAAGSFAVLLMITAICHIVWVTHNPDTLAWELSAAIVGLSVTMATALFLVVVRSAFQSFAERNANVPLPDHIRPFFDMVVKPE